MTNYAKDPTNTYRKAYIDKLTDQISINPGNYLKIYDVVPNDAVAPYIILSTTLLTPIQNSDSFLFAGTIVIDIITRFTSGSGGQKTINDISTQVFSKILTRHNIIYLPKIIIKMQLTY